MSQSVVNATSLPFKKKEFDEMHSDAAIQQLFYGIKVLYGKDKHSVIVYPHMNDMQLIVLQNYKEAIPSKLEVIDLREVIDICEKDEEYHAFLSQITLILKTAKVSHLLVFDTKTNRDLFHQSVQDIIIDALANKKTNLDNDGQRQFALDLFTQGDRDLSATLSFDEAFELLKKCNVPLSKSERLEKFKAYDMNRDHSLSREEFVSIAKNLLEKKEFIDLFSKYVPNFNKSIDLNTPIMNIEQFKAFVLQEQQSDEELKDNAAQIQGYFEQKKNLISYNDFVNLLFNYSNTIFNPKKQHIYQKMDHPLTDYYINSSHNTYLMANQLTGSSNVQAYINAFRKGCRCVEIDVWDGSEPMVTHGFTLTSSIKFRDVVQTIQDYGFTWSKYPIILSIENHCNKENQKQMASIMKEIFGSQLYLIPDDHQELINYPSPKLLKRKVIVKSKGTLSKIVSQKISSPKKSSSPVKGLRSPPNSLIKSSQNTLNDLFEISQFSLSDQINLNQVYEAETCDSLSTPPHGEHAKSELLRIPTMRMFKSIKSSVHNNPNQDLQEEDDEHDDHYTKYQVLEVKDFQRCISMVGMTFKPTTLELPQQGNQSASGDDDRSIFDIYSFSEEKIENLFLNRESAIVNFNKRHFSRIYPKGSRVNSSNYDPILSFNSGSQVIALNFQTNDEPLFLYLSRFQKNGGISSGYILKPEFLRNPASTKIPSSFNQTLKTLSITIISGQCLRTEEDETNTLNPLIEISIKGVDIDQKKNQPFRTTSIQNNTFHPIFNSKTTPSTASFSIAVPELAMVVFSVISKGIFSEDLIAQYALDFDCIRPGYRIIPLWDRQLNIIPHSFIMAHISIN